MGSILRHWRTSGAVAFSLLLILGAYAAARGFGAPRSAQASSETALLQAIAAKDSDGDGLPDWEEALYGTDPHNPDTRGLGMTDGQAVEEGLIVPQAEVNLPAAPAATTTPAADPDLPPPPGSATLTDAFAKNFFTLYLNAKDQNNGAALTSAQTAQLAEQAVAQLQASITPTPPFKAAGDLTVSGSGPQAMTQFAADAERVFLASDSSATTSEIYYLQDAENGDAAALPELAAIAQAYRTGAAGLAALPVPQELASQDLALINALARVGEIVQDFTEADRDPLVTMLALTEYPQAVLDLGNAFIGIRAAYKTAGITLPAGTPGAAFVNVIDDIAAEQAASTTP